MSSSPKWIATITVHVLLIAAVFRPGVHAQDIADVERRYNDFLPKARELYRFDQEKLDLIWMAYCGELDPSVPGGKEIAGDVGYAFQRDGEGRLNSLYQSISSIRTDADRLEDVDSTRSRARVVLEGLSREEVTLNKVKDGVVLRGSNHPFTQYALEHGKKMHLEGCREFRGDPVVCDQPFPTIGRQRPDLVTVSGERLMVYEFKPEGQESKAQNEANDYVKGVQEYYQRFFPEGRTGPTNGVPDSSLGGEQMLKALQEADDAWSSDGKTLRGTPKGETYERCQKPA